MSGDKETRKQRKKKKRFGYYLYAVVILVLTIANITLATLLLTHVQKREIKGLETVSKKEVEEWIDEDPLTVNSLYTLWKFKSGAYKKPVWMEQVSAKLTAPWAVKVQVQEKQVIGCLIQGKSYVYFDAEGLVLDVSSKYRENTPLIEGMKTKKAEKYSYLKVEKQKVFTNLVSLNKELRSQELIPDRMVWEDGSMNLYFGGVCARLGTSDFEIKILQLPPILEKLGDKEGVLQMEHYTSDSTNISFQEKKY